jgi:ERCC4-related helicase
LRCIKSLQRVDQYRLIERNLNALSKSPRIHRADLRRFVHLPQLIPINYGTQPASETSPLLGKLKNGLPLVRVHTTVVSGRDKNRSLMDNFHRKASHVSTELGHWAVEHYIDQVLANLLESPNFEMDKFRHGQRAGDGHIQSVSSHLRLPPATDHDTNHSRPKVSLKVQELIKFLVSQNHSQMSGILFVEQRITAVMLPKLLSAHPDTKHLSYATFVGTSNPSIYSRCPTELIDLDNQKTTLDDFRSQKCNIVIATNVLEEGIDISSCNLVICFNKPANLKSFIQRRGRARERKSIFVLMLAHDDMLARSKDWEAMEADMLKMFQEQRRKAEKELQLEDSEESRHRRFKIESTG